MDIIRGVVFEEIRRNWMSGRMEYSFLFQFNKKKVEQNSGTKKWREKVVQKKAIAY